MKEVGPYKNVLFSFMGGTKVPREEHSCCFLCYVKLSRLTNATRFRTFIKGHRKLVIFISVSAPFSKSKRCSHSNTVGYSYSSVGCLSRKHSCFVFRDDERRHGWGRGVKLIVTGGHISLEVAFKGLNIISGLYKRNYTLTRGKELGTAAK